jgi:glutamyl-tRNA synthetase
MKPAVLEPLAAAEQTLRELQEWDPDAIESALRALMERLDIGARQVLQPIRVAISGSSISPGIFESLAALGRERSVERIGAAVERLRNDA